MVDIKKNPTKPWPQKYPGVRVARNFPVGPDPNRPTRTDMIPGKKYPGVHVAKNFPVGPDPDRPTRTDMNQRATQE